MADKKTRGEQQSDAEHPRVWPKYTYNAPHFAHHARIANGGHRVTAIVAKLPETTLAAMCTHELVLAHAIRCSWIG